jgi:hypothetical protein
VLIKSLKPRKKMQPIEIEPNHFINKDHIVEFIYKPSTARTEKVHAETDPDVPKTTWVTVESSLTLKLSDSRTIPLSGARAEKIYSEIAGKRVNKIPGRPLANHHKILHLLSRPRSLENASRHGS